MRRPLSLAQQAMLEADQLRPGMLSDKATISVGLRVCGPLDLDRLAAAYDLLVRRHEILRMRLVAAGGARGEVDHGEVLPHRPAFPEIVRTEVEVAGAGHTLSDEALFAHWDELTVDPHRPPLVRCFVVPRQPDEHLLGLVFSHIVVDPAGARIAIRELAECYDAGASASDTPLEAAAQYSDYARWEAARLAERGEGDRAAWKRILAGSRPARYKRQVAFVAGRPAAPRVAHVPLFSKPEIDAIARWSWRHRSTLSITLLAAYARAIREDADRDDLMLATVFEQRDHPGAREMLGIFLKAAPVRLRVRENEPMSELVVRTRAAVLEAYQRAQVPLLEYLKLMPRFVPGAVGLAPTWLRFFQYVPMARVTYRFGEATATIVHQGGRGDPRDQFGVQLGVYHAEDGGLHGRFSYDTHELTEGHAHTVLDDFRDFALAVAS